MNHPSYQELGDANNNRRRRRRRVGLGDVVAKEEPRMPSTHQLTLLSDREAEIEAEPEVPTSDLPLSVNSKVGWIEKPERARPTKPEPVKPVIEPPETVYVEMTPEEQDVYALMGVSPLVRLNREVKNPKSVIVHVTLPGQVPDTSTVSENSTPAPTLTNEIAEVETYNTVSPVVSPSESFDSLAESFDSPSESFVSPAESFDSLAESFDSPAESFDSLAESFDSPAESLPDATTELSSAATTTNESEPASTLPARRRRRRSSATENSMEE